MAADSADPERDMALGLARLREAWLNQAELAFRRVLATSPGRADAMRYLGITLARLGASAQALDLLAAAAATEPSTAAGWFDLAVARRDAGRDAEARDAYARGRELLPEGLAAERIVPLDALVYSVEGGAHDFKIVDYPYRAQVRYGAGKPPHAGLDQLIGAGRTRYVERIERLAALRGEFERIAVQGSYAASTPFWLNTWFPPLDAMLLHAMLVDARPRHFVEIGSGMSTKFARNAIARHGLSTRIVSIDPQPRNDIDSLADRVLRMPLERVPPASLDELGAGDILFVDSSHRAFQNSDVTAFFLDLLPRLALGVLVHVHDIYLPWDYPSGHLWRLWNEQYLLACALLYGARGLQIDFPCWYVSRDPELSARVEALLRRGPLERLSLHGASFWLRTVAPG